MAKNSVFVAATKCSLVTKAHQVWQDFSLDLESWLRWNILAVAVIWCDTWNYEYEKTKSCDKHMDGRMQERTDGHEGWNSDVDIIVKLRNGLFRQKCFIPLSDFLSYQKYIYMNGHFGRWGFVH